MHMYKRDSKSVSIVYVTDPRGEDPRMIIMILAHENRQPSSADYLYYPLSSQSPVEKWIIITEANSPYSPPPVLPLHSQQPRPTQASNFNELDTTTTTGKHCSPPSVVGLRPFLPTHSVSYPQHQKQGHLDIIIHKGRLHFLPTLGPTP
ncbi:hypothetical protein H4Q26_005674 [Puccinia striiformis f. sp. tritici PST-130]|nr:hypothetical protein H4Q26_005674 [Puccinia striiformis f. sp. tritici PST-130]